MGRCVVKQQGFSKTPRPIIQPSTEDLSLDSEAGVRAPSEDSAQDSPKLLASSPKLKSSIELLGPSTKPKPSLKRWMSVRFLMSPLIINFVEGEHWSRNCRISGISS